MLVELKHKNQEIGNLKVGDCFIYYSDLQLDDEFQLQIYMMVAIGTNLKTVSLTTGCVWEWDGPNVAVLKLKQVQPTCFEIE